MSVDYARPLFVYRTAGGLGSSTEPPPSGIDVVAALPAFTPESLGDPGFRRAHAVEYAYVAGEMATGIASTALVIAMGRAGMLGFFGAAGLPVREVERAIGVIESELGARSFGVNLIHSPNEPLAEEEVTDLLLRRGVKRVCASAFMALSPHVVRYAASGLSRGPDGRIVRPHQVFAKISRPEVARHFMSPPPPALLQGLVQAGKLRIEEAELAAQLPVAEDITVEADSGGHTDNRPLVALFPVIARQRDELMERFRYERPIRVGAAGGLATPSGVAAAFALGAAYVVTGSVNQATLEAGTSPEVKAMLAQASLADVAMAPAGDMFELGVKVQVLKRGTLFPQRAAQLYQLYTSHESLDAIAPATRAQLERDLFKKPLDTVWAETRSYWQGRDAREVQKAEANPKHKMALTFRWYLGGSSRWARAGDATRKLDYQIWCGPAMGAFNAWAAGSFLEKPERRGAVIIAQNLLAGAAAVTRAGILQSLGLPLPEGAFDFRPTENPFLLKEVG